MRVLVVFHGAVPSAEAPTSGGALRALTHAAALRGAGHTVGMLNRRQDGPDGFESPRDLRRLAERFEPDWILCVAPTEAEGLAPVAPLVVDLYAPRMLEAAWEGTQQIEADRALSAIHAADEVLMSNPRQRWWWTGMLGLCGWDLSRPAGLLVPLTALDDAPPRQSPERLRLVLGGHPWPWQDPSAAIEEALRLLDGRGELVTVGLPPRPGVTALPALSRPEWLRLCAVSSAALDRYAPHLEREMALSFRQMDYLACGLPLISDAHHVLGPEIAEMGAGWLGPMSEAINELFDEQSDVSRQAARTERVRRLAARYQLSQTHAPLLAWTPRRRERTFSVVGAARERAALRDQLGRARGQREVLLDEVKAKRAEVVSLVSQNAALTASIERLSAAMVDVAGFRRETVAVLGTRLSVEHEEAEFLRRELEILRADVAKKDQELRRGAVERDRLGGLLAKIKR